MKFLLQSPDVTRLDRQRITDTRNSVKCCICYQWNWGLQKHVAITNVQNEGK